MVVDSRVPLRCCQFCACQQDEVQGGGGDAVILAFAFLRFVTGLHVRGICDDSADQPC